MRVSRTSVEGSSRHMQGASERASERVCIHDSYAHPQDLTGLQTDQVSNLLAALTGRRMETPNAGGLPVLGLVCSHIPPEVEHIPGTWGDFSCALPPD